MYTDYPEVDQNFMIQGDSILYFVQNRHEESHIFRIKNNGIDTLFTQNPILNNIYLSNGSITGLRDSCGNEQYNSAEKEINQALGQEKIERLYSGHTGKYLIYKTTTTQNVYLYSWKTKTQKLLLPGTINFQHVCFSANDSLALFCEQGKMYKLYLAEGRIQEVVTQLQAEILNPSFAENEIYFCSRDTGNYTAIYRISLSGSSSKAQLVYREAKNDLRMPLKQGNDLYYIEVSNSNYLLSRLNLKTDSAITINTSGVVYTYQAFGKNILFTYSNIRCPKILVDYATDLNQCFYVLPLPARDTTLSAALNTKESTDSNTYNIGTQHSYGKAVVLYIHPGIHNDFSPRYDPILASLAHKGYQIIAPNYPGSTGYGWSYAMQSQDSAVEYLNKLKLKIKALHPNKQILVLSQSSGNALAEKLISKYPDHITAAASLFGVSTGNTPNFKVPYVYILGINDPIVKWTQRIEELRHSPYYNRSIRVYNYPAEGHWFRNPEHLETAIHRIEEFFSTQQPKHI
ncbi:S9 family peptidase [Chitinophaga oryziterrae]|nr:alpha/beta hydrolase [Chitinophaga oryziterrae]